MIGRRDKAEQLVRIAGLLICTPPPDSREGGPHVRGLSGGVWNNIWSFISCDFDISCHLTKSPRPTSVTCLQPDTQAMGLLSFWTPGILEDSQGHKELVECLSCKLWQ